MKHAALSPSSSHRWLVCPGSVEANASKKHTSNPYALEGTSAHALLEVCLLLGSDPADHFGEVLEKGLMPVDEGMIDGVGYALDYVKSYTANHPKTKVLIEQKMTYGKSVGATDEQGFGWADIVLDNHPVEVVAIDYKHGVGNAVSVKDNSQLLLYLLGMRQARGKYQRYRSVVVQPRLLKRKPVQEAPAITDAQLLAWANKTVRPVVPIALAGGAPRVAGAHCRYCAADGNCNAQYDLVMEAARREFKAC